MEEFGDLVGKELLLLQQAVDNLALKTGYNFCHGCYDFGKKEEFNVIVCDSCNNSICNTCDTINELNGLDLCDGCYDNIKDKYIFTLILYHNDKPIDINIDNDIIQSIIDDICFESDEYYNYYLEFVTTKNINNELTVFAYFTCDDEKEDNNIIPYDDLYEELTIILDEMETYKLNDINEDNLHIHLKLS